MAFFPSDLYSVDLFVVPMWGLYANMIAQLISQISSHFIVYYHRRIILQAKKEYVRQQGVEASQELSSAADAVKHASRGGDKPEARLCQTPFLKQHRLAPETLTVRRFINYLILLVSLAVCVLLAVSCDLASMKLEALGVVALLIELGQNLEQAVRYESVFTISELLVEQARFLGGVHNFIGLGTLAFLFVLTVLVVPICQIAALLYQWFAPISANRKVAVGASSFAGEGPGLELVGVSAARARRRGEEIRDHHHD